MSQATPYQLGPVRVRVTFSDAVAALLVAFTCVLLALHVDRPLALAVRNHLPAAAVGAFKMVSRIGEAGWYFAGGGLALAWFLWLWRTGAGPAAAEAARRAWRAGFFLAAMGLSGLALVTLKYLFGRLRPRYLFQDGRYGFEGPGLDFGMLSFPSGHSQTIFAAAAALGVLWPRARGPLFGIALLVGLSRVMVGAHFLGDVVAGAFLALVVVGWLRLQPAFGLNPSLPTGR